MNEKQPSVKPEKNEADESSASEEAKEISAIKQTGKQIDPGNEHHHEEDEEISEPGTED